MIEGPRKNNNIGIENLKFVKKNNNVKTIKMVPCHQYYFLEHMSRHAPINIIDVTFWQNTAVCKPFLVPMIHFLVTNYLFSNWFQLDKRNDAN